jgi:endonuclease G
MKFYHILIVISFVCALGSCKKTEDNVEPVTNDTIKAPTDTSIVITPPDSLTEDNMLMGNPSNAAVNVATPDNYLAVKHQYTLSYNSSKGTPNWVSWHLSSAWKGTEPRCDCFNTDYTLPTTFYRSASYDYTGTGFDRGHMCPSDDRDLNTADNTATFLMSNIIPQAPKVNQQPWNGLENYCITLMNQGNELYIISGGYGNGGTGTLGGVTNTIANGNIVVPSNCWKVIVIIPVGKDDVSRVTTATRVIAVDMPNTEGGIVNQWGNYRVSVDDIETATGYNFLTSLSSTLQNSLESTIDNGPTQ